MYPTCTNVKKKYQSLFLRNQLFKFGLFIRYTDIDTIFRIISEFSLNVNAIGRLKVMLSLEKFLLRRYTSKSTVR